MLVLEIPCASRPAIAGPDADKADEALADLLHEVAKPNESAARPLTPPLLLFAGVGPRHGPFRLDAGFDAIAVLEARDNPAPIGEAVVAGQGDDGLALWRMTIDGIELPGLWAVIDGEFWPV